ncbi:hypothetical protein FRC03_000304 [Tulasnella sp. 419]|nr:hypothetical protein FRC03_000304 [Tulasnella sp. 419]
MSLNFPPGLAISPSQVPWEELKGSDDAVEEVRVEQDISNFGIAGRIWEAAYLMRMYLRQSLPSVGLDVEFDPPCSLLDRKSPKVVVELGSGTGYVGLEVARCLSDRDTVILTDLKEVCPNLERNVSASSVKQAKVLVRPLGWGCFDDGEKLKVEDLRGSGLSHIVCSDLVYFPPLLPPLLRTLLQLTGSSFASEPVAGRNVEIIISYKIRCLEFEAPFWSAFGAYFNFEPVYSRRKRKKDSSEEWIRFGATSSGWDVGRDGEEKYFIFIARRKPESLEWPIPERDEELMNGRGDSTFETLLLLDMDI